MFESIKEVSVKVAFFALSIVALGVIMNCCSPGSAGPSVVLMVLFLIYVVSYLLFETIIMMVFGILGVIGKASVTSCRKYARIYMVAAAVPVLLIGYNTLGSFGAAEIILVLVFAVLLSVYVYKSRE